MGNVKIVDLVKSRQLIRSSCKIIALSSLSSRTAVRTERSFGGIYLPFLRFLPSVEVSELTRLRMTKLSLYTERSNFHPIDFFRLINLSSSTANKIVNELMTIISHWSQLKGTVLKIYCSAGTYRTARWAKNAPTILTRRKGLESGCISKTESVSERQFSAW